MNPYPSFSLLSAWTPQQQEKFIDGLSHVFFVDGHVIFERGDASDDVYFILSGAVKSLNTSADGKISYFRMRQAGDCFGYYSAISEKPRTATMLAVGETELARIKGEDFFALVLEHPEIGRPFMKLIVGLLRVETDRLTHLTTLATHRRVAAELLAQSRAQSSHTIPLPDRVEFASYMGMTRETLSRALSLLSRKKLIRLSGNMIVIVNEQGLGRIAYQTA
jgi:CRP/FNR family transcriptional regulator